MSRVDVQVIRVSAFGAPLRLMRAVYAAGLRLASVRRRIRVEDLSDHAQRDLGLAEGRVSEAQLRRAAGTFVTPSHRSGGRWTDLL